MNTGQDKSFPHGKDVQWTKDYEPWQFAYCFRENPNMDKSIKNRKEIYEKMKEIEWDSMEAWMYKQGWEDCYYRVLEAIEKVEKQFKESFFE